MQECIWPELSVTVADGIDAQFSLCLTQSTNISVTLGASATLTLTCVQMGNEPIEITQRATIENNAIMHWQNITLGSAVNQSVETTLRGTHARSSVDWVFYARSNDTQNIRATNIFNAGHGGGEMLLKGVAEENATIQVDGLIDIGLGGGGTDTYLTEDVLMLDPTAVVHAVPGLEIKTNDVKASHSATVSRVTPEDLFYFGARGIAEREARQMYVEGFLGAITAGISSKSIREIVVQAIENKYTTTYV